MGKLPILSGRELISLLEKDGFSVVRTKGSHASMQKGSYRTVVPLHDELDRGTMMGIMKQCGLTREKLEQLQEK